MNTKSPIAQRLAALIQYTKLNPTAFARSINVGQPAISLILTGQRDSISVDMVEKITNRYTEISTEWLLFGRGEMIKEKKLGKKYPEPGTLDPQVMEEEKTYEEKKEGMWEALLRRVDEMDDRLKRLEKDK